MVIDNFAEGGVDSSWFRSIKLWVISPARFCCVTLLEITQDGLKLKFPGLGGQGPHVLRLAWISYLNFACLALFPLETAPKPKKPVADIKKKWSDIKVDVKRKVSAHRGSMGQTGSDGQQSRSRGARPI